MLDHDAAGAPPALSDLAPLRVFFADPPVDSPLLSIHALGTRERMPPGLVNRPTGTGDHLIMVFHGEIELQFDGQPSLHPGHTLLICAPGSGHHYGHRHRSWWHSWLHCAGTQFASHLAAARIPCGVPIAGCHPQLLESCVEAIHHEIHGHVRPDEVIIGNLLHNFVRETARIVHAPGQREVPAAYLELRRWLEAHFAEPIALKDLARRIDCSVPHFCNEFKRHFQSSAIEFVIRLRLNRATMLLRDRNHRIGSIARAVGYDDLHHFSKLFSKHLGRSPRAMRRDFAAGG